MQRKKNSSPARRTRGLLTRERILDAAERVFAAQGLGASLRTVMVEAGVNVASIHYYFGSKERLLDDVVKRRAIIINNERLARLAEVLAARGKPNPTGILDALMRPALTYSLEGPPGWSDYFRILSRLESSARDTYAAIIASYYNKMHSAFLDALKKALPRLNRDDLAWRLLCVVWVMSHAANVLEPAREFPSRPSDADEVMRRLLPPLAALFTAPATRQ